MRHLPAILFVALFAAPACAEQVPSPTPNPAVGTSPEIFPNDAAWKREHLGEFIKADKDSDGKLSKDEYTEFRTLIEAKRLKAATSPSPPIAVVMPPSVVVVPGPPSNAPVVPVPAPNQPIIPPLVPLPDPHSPVVTPLPQPVPMAPPIVAPAPRPVTPPAEPPNR